MKFPRSSNILLLLATVAIIALTVLLCVLAAYSNGMFSSPRIHVSRATIFELPVSDTVAFPSMDAPKPVKPPKPKEEKHSKETILPKETDESESPKTDDSLMEMVAPQPNETLPDKYYRSKLNNQLFIHTYDSIEKGIRNFDEQVRVSGITVNEMLKIVGYVLADNSDIFWCEVYFDYGFGRDGLATALLPIYKYDKDTVRELQREIEDKTNIALAMMPAGINNYDKARYICGWISANSNVVSDLWSTQDIGSVFFSGASACGGYSHAFQYMCNRAGIKACYIAGTVTNESGDIGSHAWAVFNADGKNYYVDPSWGDNGTTFNDDWFGLDLPTISKTHKEQEL